MKTIIAGSRKGAIARYVNIGVAEIESLTGMAVTEVVSGMAPGADTLGVLWAKQANVKVSCFPAEWQKDGKTVRSAGHTRNRRMGDYADALIAIWDGKSNGTRGMIEYAEKKGLPIVIVNYAEGILNLSIIPAKKS